jgi:benzoyl-CoA reductase/2-hydroxyglutaryl-CoA dehydratase subunit BcrC/BadD/HgdB
MSSVIEKLGHFAEKNLEQNPLKVRRLLKAAYKVSGWQMKYLPEKAFSASQRQLAVICNQSIQRPLWDADKSVIVNMFFPCAPIHAMGLEPLCAEGLAAYINGAGCDHAFIRYAEAHGLPPSYCSYHKILMAAALSDFLPRPAAVLYTSLVCDANNISFRSIAEHYDVPSFFIDVPNNCHEESVDYVAEQLRGLPDFLCRVSGRSFDEARLIEAIKRENRSLRLYEQYLQQLSTKEVANNFTSEMYRVLLSHILAGRSEVERYYAALLQEAQNSLPATSKLRILWAHTLPNWQRSLSDLFKYDPRYQLLACDLNFDAAVEIDETDIYRGLAQKLLTNTLGGPIERRAQKLRQMAHCLKADGLIYFCHWGCKSTQGGAQLIKDYLQEEGIPILVMDGDGCDRNNVNEGQMLTRLQAFLEMLEDKRK